MRFRETKFLVPLEGGLPFSIEWIQSDPQQVESILRSLTIQEQARCVMQLSGRQKQDLLQLSPQGKAVAKALSPEEVYFMVKEIGQEDALPLLSLATQSQLQYIFDIEWWQKDKFMPDRALTWLNLLNKVNDLKIFDWFVNEDTDQIVMVLQSLVKVFKKDEMTDSYIGVDGFDHFTLDGDYDIFVCAPEAFSFVKRFFKLLRERQPEHFYALLEEVIWSPITPTVEKAYNWRIIRMASHGIPELKEAVEIYSRLDPATLSESVASPEDFIELGNDMVAPNHLMAHVDTSGFFGQCLTLIKDFRRLETIRWELVYLANKVMVADKRDPSNLEDKKEVMQKVLNWVNIGLELGSEADTQRGVKLLEQTWLQPLFQVGYGQLIQLQWASQKLLKDYGENLEYLLEDGENDQFNTLVAHAMPHREELKTKTINDFKSLSEFQAAEKQIQRYKFYIRFTEKALGLTPLKIKEMIDGCIQPVEDKDCSVIWLTVTTLANYILFQNLCSQPLSDLAAKAFLEMIFLPSIYEDEPRQCNKNLITTDYFIKTPLAWTPQDCEFLKDLLIRCEESLMEHFGRIDLKKPIRWEFTSGLFIRGWNAGD